MKIIVDAFGGDHAPAEILKGCEQAVSEYGVNIILTGDENIIREVSQKENISLSNIEIVHAEQAMPVEAEPAEIMKSYKDCSMAKGLRLLSEGAGDAFVSAGSTGALLVGGTMIVKRIKGIKRPALATVIPASNGRYMLLDCGANSECRPEMLVQFAIMGSAYMQRLMNVQSPRVGLINIGAEETKGLALQVEAHAMLKAAPVNFVGNVEPRSLPLGEVDVAVADGFTGNVVLKLTEGLGKMFNNQLKGIFYKNIGTKFAAIIVSNGLKLFKKQMDYKEYGGAPLLGLAKPVIKAHGSSDARAIKNAIRQAVGVVKNDVISQIQLSISEMKAQDEPE
ncbi:MAG TPA: phosphate acyltransferase PlsX [Ruminococcaceae bacterium]|nr:phosphate acyltransferase PlsX [Oscillospiraceae bacterium]